MKYVLDSSVAFKWLVPELNSDKALRLRDAYRNGTVELVSPDVFPIEVVHSLTRAERRNRVTSTQGVLLFHALLANLPTLHGSLTILPRAYQISSQARIGVYDCLHVALAEREGCELVTADDRLQRNLRSTFPLITSLASRP